MSNELLAQAAKAVITTYRKADEASCDSLAWDRLDDSAFRALEEALAAHEAPAAVPRPITEAMHVAACKVLTRASGLDGTPQRMLGAMFAAAPQPQQAGVMCANEARGPKCGRWCGSELCKATPPQPQQADYSQISPEQAAEILAAVDLVELPPIRVRKAAADFLLDRSNASGRVVQAEVREILEAAAATPPQPTAPAPQAQAMNEGRTNRGDETGGTVKRFGWDCTGNKPEIISATNGAFVWYSDYLELFRKVAPPEWTPEMSRAVQLYSELGAYAAANLSGAYDLFEEFWRVAIQASRPAEAQAKSEPAAMTDEVREAILEAADEWSNYVVEDTAPRTLRKHFEIALAAIAATQEQKP